jgi:acid phosphatase
MQVKTLYRLISLFVLTSLVIGTNLVAYASTSAASAQATTNFTFTPTADAYVTGSSPDNNYGASTSLLVDNTPLTYSYLRFDVNGLNGSAIQSAKLRIYANSSNSVGYSVVSVSDNTWAEDTITFNNAPAAGNNINNSQPITGKTWTEVDISGYVQAEGTYSLVLVTTSDTNTNLASRESGTNAPQLVVTTASQATATPTSLPTSTKAPTLPPTNVPTATATVSQGQDLTFTPAADTYVNSASNSTNYGGSTSLRVDASPVVESYLRFTVQGLSGQVGQARLLIYASSGSTQGLVAQSVADNTWDEMTLTYANAPAMGSTLASSPAVSGGTWITLDVTSYVTGNGTFSFGITTPGSTAIGLASRESGANSPKLVVSAASSVGPTATPTSTSAIKHVFVVVMENHSYSQVWNTSSSPYITSLGNAYTRATNYYATIHPSLPNYLDIYGGSNYSITTDCNPSTSCHINATNLADNLEAKGLTWKGYMEGMPSPCYITTSGTYAPKHNPFVYFDDIRTNSARCSSHDVPYTSLASDLASASTTPNYAMIVPNLCNDMHDCSVSTGDTWLKNNLPAILNSPACKTDKCLLVLTWDEDDGNHGNQVLTIFAGSEAKTGGVTSAVSYTHFSLLHTIEKIFGLPTQTSNDAAANLMTDMLR